MKKKSTKKKGMKKDFFVSCNTDKNCNSCGCGGIAYFLGVLGAAVYYIQTTSGFWNGVVGVLKALVWPAFLIHKLLGFIGA